MTPTRVGLLGLAAVGTTVTLLTRLFVQALKDIDVEIGMDPYGSPSTGLGLSSPLVIHQPLTRIMPTDAVAARPA